MRASAFFILRRMNDLLYIHGFLSSPQSTKAQQLIRWAEEHHPELRLHMPALSVDPESAMAILESTLQRCGTAPGLIGSSLGGFYANILAARHGLRAVLVNPAVHPHMLLKAHVGEQRNHHTGELVQVEVEHFSMLEHLEAKPLYPERLWVLLETGDETLDYRQAERFYQGCAIDITSGGSHSYDGFVQKLPAINQFLFK